MKRLVTLALALIASSSAWAMDLSVATGRFGVMIIRNVEDTAPNPVLNTLGGSVELTLGNLSFMTLEPGLDVMWSNYEWFEDRRAAPTPAETGEGNNVFVLGMLLDVPLVFSARFSERLGGAASIGTSLLFRASFAGDTTVGTEAAMAYNLSRVSAYFWQAGRWLYPSAALRFDVYVQDGYTFAVGLRGFLPLFNAWTGDVSFWDAAMLHVTLGMRVTL